jgi:hypothetical protein
LEQGRPWYYGLPYTWWWGMNFNEIESHVLRPEEPEWIERLLK